MAEYTEVNTTTKAMEFIAEKRAKSDTSVLFVRHSDKSSEVEYHLLTLE